MKMIIQADDFGITKGCTYGIIEGIENGLIRNSGLFTNMPASLFAAEYMKKHPDFCWGIDFNVVCGDPVSDPSLINSLVDANGHFLKSGKIISNPEFASEEGRRKMFPYEQCYREVRAQYDRFVKLCGFKPKYLNGHSIMHENLIDAFRKVGEEEHLNITFDFWGHFNMHLAPVEKNDRSTASLNKTFDAQEQLNCHPVNGILENSEQCLGYEYMVIACHPGYLDPELLDYTSLSIRRIREYEMVTSPKLISWVSDNAVELIRYEDFDYFEPDKGWSLL